MKERLKNNIEILKQHNLTHEPVYHITDGKKHEIDLINEIVADCEEIFNDEEQGLIVRLPCKVGDKIYRRLSKFGFDVWTVESINIHIDCFGIDYTIFCKSDDGCGYDTFYKEELNEDWFLTRAEAEKKLKELKGEK